MSTLKDKYKNDGHHKFDCNFPHCGKETDIQPDQVIFIANIYHPLEYQIYESDKDREYNQLIDPKIDFGI